MFRSINFIFISTWFPSVCSEKRVWWGHGKSKTDQGWWRGAGRVCFKVRPFWLNFIARLQLWLYSLQTILHQRHLSAISIASHHLHTIGVAVHCVCWTDVDKSDSLSIVWIYGQVLFSGSGSRRSIAPPQGPTEPASKEMWQGEHAEKPSVTT